MRAFVVFGFVYPSWAKWLAWGSSPKWPILCRVERKTLPQSITEWVLCAFLCVVQGQLMLLQDVPSSSASKVSSMMVRHSAQLTDNRDKIRQWIREQGLLQQLLCPRCQNGNRNSHGRWHIILRSQGIITCSVRMVIIFAGWLTSWVSVPLEIF